MSDPNNARQPQPAAGPLKSAHTLTEGTRLFDFRITSVLGEGGFGIVYLAVDESLERQVAVKEYLPASIASRAAGSTTVIVRSDNQRETFERGLKSFVNEAKLLARFDHPSLVKVYRFWEANDTAYMAMPYYEGPTLKRALADLGRAPDETEIRQWLWPLLAALEVLHEANCFHRDIAPDNILLTATGPVLLDFGAARRVVGELTHELTAILKPGFAPIEQYGDIPGMSQGAWTDIYAVAGVVYAAIARRRPVPSIERLLSDQLPPLRDAAAGRYREPFLAAVDAALALRPENRPQTVAAFRAMLDGVSAPALAPSQPPPSPVAERNASPESATTVLLTRPGPTPLVAPPAPAAVAAPQASRPGYARYAWVALAALVAAAGLGYRFVWTRPAAQAAPPATPPASVAAPRPAPPAAQDAAPAPSAATATPPSAAASAVVAAPPVPQPEAASVPAARPPGRLATPPTTAAVPPRAPPAIEPARAAPAADAKADSRCGDILQKGSLEPLTPAETEYLRRNCR